MSDKTDEICSRIAIVLCPPKDVGYPDGSCLIPDPNKKKVEKLLKRLIEEIKQEMLSDLDSTYKMELL
jgi:hypothetical protein